ncbi:hypothetical protein GE09DRAFT_1294573 [Coniochaeta sp. 2T2.1]|nr:hypothetical protein GE09DRAFT_1294573 [Coniochaeta sp. 2T2.1]
MSSLLSRKTWPYATNSTGRHRGSLNLGFLGVGVQVYEAIGPARAIDMDRLSQEVVKYLNDNGATLQESVCFVDLSLFMVGKSLLRTKPTLMFVSNDKATRLEAFNMIKRSTIMEAYPGFGLGHMELRAEFENLQALAGQAGSTGPFERSNNPKLVSHPAKQRVYTNDVGCLSGARLFTKGNGDSRFQNSATAGGIVSFGGCYMAHTVNHFLEEGTRAHDKPMPSAIGNVDAPDCEVTGLSDFEDDSEDVLTDITSRGSMTPKSARSRSTSSPTDENKTVDGEVGSVVSEDIVMAREDFLVSVDERLECLTPSSPSSPPVPADLLAVEDLVTSSRALDYCLIRIDNKYGSRIAPEDRDTLFSDAIPLENYPNTSKTYHAMPPYGQPRPTVFQEIYTGKLNAPPVFGDCGSWIRDAVSGKLYGHVISGSPTTGLIMGLKPGAEDSSYDMVLSPETEAGRVSDIVAAGQSFDEERTSPYMYASNLELELEM